MRTSTRHAVVFTPPPPAAPPDPDPPAAPAPATYTTTITGMEALQVMAAHLDLAARLERLGVTEEVYAGDPPALLAKVATMARAGRWPIALNVKGSKPDDVLIVLSLRGYEQMVRDAEAATA